MSDPTIMLFTGIAIGIVIGMILTGLGLVFMAWMSCREQGSLND